MGKMTLAQKYTMMVLAAIAILLVFWSLIFIQEGRFKHKRTMDALHITSQFPHAKLVSFSPAENKMIIRIWGELITGTDGACETAAGLFHGLCSLDPKMVLHVQGEWIPSLRNPMTLEWTRHLIANISLKEETQEDFYRHHQN